MPPRKRHTPLEITAIAALFSLVLLCLFAMQWLADDMRRKNRLDDKRQPNTQVSTTCCCNPLPCSPPAPSPAESFPPVRPQQQRDAARREIELFLLDQLKAYADSTPANSVSAYAEDPATIAKNISDAFAARVAGSSGVASSLIANSAEVLRSLLVTGLSGGAHTAKETATFARKIAEKFVDKLVDNVVDGAADLIKALGQSAHHEKFQLFFDTDSTDLTPNSIEIAKTIQKRMKDHPDTIAVVSAFTDSTGTLNRNKLLAKERAATVRNILIHQYGIDQRLIFSAEFPMSPSPYPTSTGVSEPINRSVTVELRP